MTRTYLDHNATTPLRPEARQAMIAAMDVAGNPSSVHAEGRAARGVVETAREQVAALVSCAPEEVVFTSGATEAAALRLGQIPDLIGAGIEHPAVAAHLDYVAAQMREVGRRDRLEAVAALRLAAAEREKG